MTDLKLEKGTALVIIAHPDDEIIWMGGTLLKFKNLKWTIFSLCRGDDPDRASRFRKACKLYGAQSIISDVEDRGIMRLKRSIVEIKKGIKNKFKRRHFTFIFTHGYNGEYGHLRHRGVHQAVKQLIVNKKLSAEKIFAFSYQLDEKKKKCVPDAQAGFTVMLSQKLFNAKKNIIEKIYNFKSSSFESKSCSKVETFNLLK